MYKLKKHINEVKKPKDLDPAFLKRIEKRFGEVDMVNDFFDDELATYFKTDDINKETGSVSHKVIKLGNFGDALKELSQALEAVNNLSKSADGEADPKIAVIAQQVRDVFNKFRTHIRKEYPEQYVTIKNLLDETSSIASNSSFTSGTEGENYATPFAFNPNKKAKGAATNYYYKLGFKPAPKPKSSKTIDIVNVNGKTKPLNEAETNVEEYINNLGIESSALKKHITSRILGFNKVEEKLNELIPLLAKAKQDTMDHYKDNPDFSVVYGTDLAVDYLDDLIEMFKK
jgi:hypothetical protein